MVSFNKNSLYKYTNTTQFYRGYYEPIDLGYDESDFYLIVTSDYQYKPGNLAQALYGSPRFSWVFSYFNRDKITDIIFDLKEGLVLRLPSKQRLLSYF